MGSQTPEGGQVTSHLECLSSKPASRISLPDTYGVLPDSKDRQARPRLHVHAGSTSRKRVNPSDSLRRNVIRVKTAAITAKHVAHPGCQRVIPNKIFLCILNRILYIKPSGIIYMNLNNEQFGRRTERRSFPLGGHLRGPCLRHRATTVFCRAGNGRMTSGARRHREGKE